MKQISIVFFGTPEFVIPIVSKLYKEYSTPNSKAISAVVTQPPRPVGRKKRITHSPIDNWAYKKKIPIILKPKQAPRADLGVLAAYGEIIPGNVISKYKYGVINVHPSYLPKWRGSSPVQSSIISNKGFGVSFIKMDKELDHGPIISQFKASYNKETAGMFTEKMFERASDALIELIPNYIEGKINLTEQEHGKASFSRKLKKADGYINPIHLNEVINYSDSDSKININFMNNYKLEVKPHSIDRLIRAMNPWPMAWSEVKIKNKVKRIKIIKSHVEDEKLLLDEVQLAGKDSVTWKQFKEGYPDIKFGS